MTTDVIAAKIQEKIYIVRGLQVILDCDLAEIYSISTKRFNERIQRNIESFPHDFRFQLSEDEFKRIQQPDRKFEYGGRRHLPFAFTEGGIMMSAHTLKIQKGIGVAIVRALTQARYSQAQFARQFQNQLDHLQSSLNQLLQKQQTFVPNQQNLVTPKCHHQVEAIQQSVATYYGLTLRELKSSSRIEAIAFPRQIAMFLLRKKLGLSFQKIGFHFDGKDHTTVMHAVAKIRILEREDSEFQTILKSIESLN